MRSIIISLFIICICLSVNIVNEVENVYHEETGRTIFGFSGAKAPLSLNDLSTFSDENINTTIGGIVNPTEQPEGLTQSGFLDTLTKNVKITNTLIRTLFYSTIGFYRFCYNLGIENSDIVLIPYYIGIPLTVLVNICHYLALLEFLRGISVL